MQDLDLYLQRIGYSGARDATLETLRALQALHPLAIPFENLDTLAGLPVKLDLPSLTHKLVRSRRGGYCFEQNLLLKNMLGALGFAVTALAARVVWERPAEVRARTHMVLLVELDGERYVCDVGFGGLTLTAPLLLAPGVEQRTPHEIFRVVRDGEELAVEAEVRAHWKRLYRFDLQAQLDVDIDMSNHYVMTHAESPMRGRLMAARVATDRRFALANCILTTHVLRGASEQRRVASVAELKDVLDSTFGIAVPESHDIDAALERALASSRV